MSRAPIRSVAILGGGIVGLSAAAAFAHALPDIAVTVIDTPTDPAALADRLPGSTSAIHRFHARIGLEETMLVRSGAALPRLGLRFEGWGARTWYHVHGDHGVPLAGVPFHQLWARAWRERRAGPYHRYAAAGILAEAGRFVHPQADPRSPLATFDYALRLDPVAYRAVLARCCAALRVTVIPGELGGTDRRERGIAALLLRDGSRIAADLFIDAAGPGSTLLPGAAFECWRAWLPFDRAALGEATPSDLDPSDTLNADPAGWRWRAGLPGRTLVGEVGTGDIVLRAGRLAEPWQGNVLALGDAAVALDPLHWLPLHLAQSSIARALDLLPGCDFAPVEIAEYNRRARKEADCARDFAALHYRRWTGAKLAALHAFESRGRFTSADEDSLPRHYWIAALLGLGAVPAGTEPTATAVEANVAAAHIARVGERLAHLPAGLPPFPEYLERVYGLPAA